MPCHILLLEDQANTAASQICDLLSGGGSFRVDRRLLAVSTAAELERSPASLVLAVVPISGIDTLQLLDHLSDLADKKPLIAVLPAEIELPLLEKAAAFADDFLLWPARFNELEQRIWRFLARSGSHPGAVSERLLDELSLGQLIGRDPVFLKAMEKLPLIAASGAPILITGETGTGKELSARAIHQLSSRRDFPFIAVDCGALPEHLVENELFGHVRGAFTDAHRDQKGLIAMAEKGTLFLDEVDALPLPIQAKLLRFLQERTYKPLGSETFARADVNIIAATNRDVETIVASKQFRTDLYYRLNVFRLRLPALRERRSDILLLARHFIRNVAGDDTAHQKLLSAGAQRKLEAYDWPGNVRELFNVILQAVAFSSSTQILPEDVQLPDFHDQSGQAGFASFREARAHAVESFEKSFLEELLRKHAGNVTHAALEARKDRRTLSRMIKKYQINRHIARLTASV